MAATFTQANIRGTYGIGLPAVLEPYFAEPPVPSSPAAVETGGLDDQPASPDSAVDDSGSFIRIGGLFQQSRQRLAAFVRRDSDQKTEEDIPAGALEEVQSAVQAVGLISGAPATLAAVTGPDLQRLGLHDFEQAAVEATTFSQLAPQQKGEVVSVLRHRK